MGAEYSTNLCTREPSSLSSSASCSSIKTDPGEGESSESSADSLAPDVLSNYLVLKNIFSHLRNTDLESCCKVNRLWYSVANPLVARYHYSVFLTRYPDYDDLSDETQDHWDDSDDGINERPPYAVLIAKRALHKIEQVDDDDHNYSLQEAGELLETAVENETVTIILRICWREKMNNTDLNRFLSRFGKYVKKLFLDNIYIILQTCCKPLAEYFPNLVHLDLALADIDILKESAWVKLDPQKEMKHLRRLNMGSILQRTAFGYFFHYLSHLAPNLEEIYSFPMDLIDICVDTKVYYCVKSLEDKQPRPTEFYRNALKKVAELGIKLKSFSFIHLFAWSGRWVNQRETEPFVKCILNSSHDTLESLTLYATESFDFNSILPLISLEEIQFGIDYPDCRNRAAKFIDGDTDLRRVFPNVLAVTVITGDRRNPTSEAAKFPANQFSPWGSQIERLKLIKVSESALEKLGGIFPGVKNLEFSLPAAPSYLKVVLPVVSHYWPYLEGLTLNIANYPESEYRIDPPPCTLDSAFTGIPEDVIGRLRDPSSRKHFSPEEIQRFKEESPIGKLNQLTILKFNVADSLAPEFMGHLSAVTPITTEFGMVSHPDLKVIVRARRLYLRDLKATLQTLVNFSVEYVQ